MQGVWSHLEKTWESIMNRKLCEQASTGCSFLAPQACWPVSGMESVPVSAPGTTWGADSPHTCLPPLLPFQITASGMDASPFCGQQGSALGGPQGQREFVSSGNHLQLTFRAPASSGNRTAGLHKSFLVLYQAVSECPSWGCTLCPQPWSLVSRSNKQKLEWLLRLGVQGRTPAPTPSLPSPAPAGELPS